ncbi:MAG: chemotaxis protein CheW [Rhodobiaceae bacterium]|nr:chemotaxis protein CheW [Rhodobiaceae bacterium]
MDELLSEFLTETAESLDVVDVELVKFEQDPNNAKILDNIFRLVHTIKGTCGFLELPRLEALAHAGETLMGKFRDGKPVTQAAVTLILQSIDRIKDHLVVLEETGTEPEGDDRDLIDRLEDMAMSDDVVEEPEPEIEAEPEPEAVAEAEAEDEVVAEAEPEPAAADASLGRELRPGEVSLDELERAFQEAEGPDVTPPAIDWASEGAAPEPVAEEVHAEDHHEDDLEDPDLSEAEADAHADAVSAPAPAAKQPKKDKAEAASKSGEGTARSQSIRVNVDTLEQLMTTVSELVLTRNQLLEISRRHEDSEFKAPLQRLSNVTAELQESVMQTRMQPIGNAWQKLPRIVRDLGNELDKKIELEMIGADTELDRQVLELIKDPLTHMVRNSADHGLEDTAERPGLGKPEVGMIRLSAYHEGGHIIIEIADDGRGINVEKVKAKVLEKGLATTEELAKMTEHQIQKFIFDPGFSTATKVTSVSGRGVGMDVVRTNIELIGGSVDLKSIQGEGSTFTIKIPLTLAIVSALIVQSGGQRLAIPQLNVVELVRAQSNSEFKIETINSTPVLRLRNKLLPLVQLDATLKLANAADSSQAAENGFIIVTQVGSLQFGIIVDGVFHTEEIVVKPMSSMLKDIGMFSGTTILGDGSVILIIDPNGVAQAVTASLTTTLEEMEADAEADARSDGAVVSMLLFRAGSREPKAVPLSLVTRLEEIDVSKIEKSDGRDVVQYRGQLMPLVFVNDAVKLKTEGQQPLLVFSDESYSMGLVVDDIVDIVEDAMVIELQSDAPGIVGTAVIKDRATEIVDVGHYLPLAFEDWFERKEMTVASNAQRIVFVDDSAFFRNMITPVLRAAGYQVATFDSAVQALNALRNGARADLIISDIEMPEMDGFRFAESVRSDPKLSGTPLIALSSHNTPAAIARGRQAGFYDYVAKFDREGLIAAVKDAANPVQAAA